MKIGTISTWCLVFLIVIIKCETETINENPAKGRIFPLLPQYQGVDYLQVWNSLATLRNAVFTLISSTITVSIFNFNPHSKKFQFFIVKEPLKNPARGKMSIFQLLE